MRVLVVSRVGENPGVVRLRPYQPGETHLVHVCRRWVEYIAMRFSSILCRRLLLWKNLGSEGI